MGGGVMRTAAKTAGLFRPVLGRAASAPGTRRSTVAAPPPSASAAVADSAPISVHLEEAKGLDESANPAMSQWELDDWEFAGWKSEGEDLMEEPLPRLVFSPVPTLEEAQAATFDLTRALERANEPGQMGSVQNNAVITAMPRAVAQTFSLLQSSPEAQSVVASLVSDKNVWDAVMKNDKVKEFYLNHQSSFTENIFDNSNTNPTESAETKSEAADPPHGNNGFADFVNNVKVKATEMINNISDFIQDIFGMKPHGPEDGSSSTFQSYFTPPNAFLALAIPVILIVLFKRS